MTIAERTWTYGDGPYEITLTLRDGQLSWHSYMDDAGRPCGSSEEERLDRYVAMPAPKFTVPKAILDEVCAHAGLVVPPPLPEDQRKVLAAAAAGTFKPLQALLLAGVSPRFRDAYGFDPLYHAIVHWHADAVRVLLATGAHANASYEVEGLTRTALDLAVETGKEDIVHALLAHGAEPNERCRDGVPLVAKATSSAVALLLIDSGADVSGAAGPLLLARAAKRGNHILVAKLLDLGVDPAGALHAAAGYDRERAGIASVELLARLIALGVTPDAREADYGETALIWAARCKTSDAVAALLAAAADPAARATDGTTALGEAGQRCIASARLLLGAGAPVDGVDSKGNTALAGALFLKDEAWVDELLAAGASITPEVVERAERGQQPFLAERYFLAEGDRCCPVIDAEDAECHCCAFGP